MDGHKGAALIICGPVILSAICACILSRFAERDASWTSFLVSVLGFTVAFSIVAVVPYDIWQALLLHDADPLAEDRTASPILRHSWAAIYWLTLILCYLVCPILMEYEASGDFTVKARLHTSLRRNIVFYVVYLLVVGLALAWLIFHGEVTGNIESWCIAASNAWGLLSLTVLMGFGLVAVPRHLWCLADTREQLRRLYGQVVAKEEERLSRLFELQDVVEQARLELASHDASLEESNNLEASRQRSIVASYTMRQTLQRCEDIHRELSRTSQRGASADPPTCLGDTHCAADRATGSQLGGRRSGSTPSLRQLAQLNRTLKAAGLEARRAACSWNRHLDRCIYFEDLENHQFKAAAEQLGSRARSNVFRSSCPRACSKIRQLWQQVLIFWFRNVRARALRLLSCVCCFFSVIIVLGQLTMFDNRWSLSLLALFFKEDHGPVLTQVLCVLPLSYMTYTAYFSLFRLKIAGWYGLYGNRNTDIGSLLWCASLLARLAAPLCYHFLLLSKVKGTTFQAFMGQMNIVPAFGESFNQVFPCIIAVLCFLNLLNVYSQILQCVSLGIINFEPPSDTDDPHQAGKQLVERERRRRAEENALELHGHSTPDRLAVPLAAPAG